MALVLELYILLKCLISSIVNSDTLTKWLKTIMRIKMFLLRKWERALVVGLNVEHCMPNKYSETIVASSVNHNA